MLYISQKNRVLEAEDEYEKTFFILPTQKCVELSETSQMLFTVFFSRQPFFWFVEIKATSFTDMREDRKAACGLVLGRK